MTRTLLMVALALGAPMVVDATPRSTRATSVSSSVKRGSGSLLVAQRRRRRKARKKRRRATPPPLVDTKNAPGRKAPTGTEAVSTVPGPGALRRSRRIEFDGRLIQGQTAKSGAIYLFARKRSELRSMVLERDSFRTEVVRTLLPNFKRKK